MTYPMEGPIWSALDDMRKASPASSLGSTKMLSAPNSKADISSVILNIVGDADDSETQASSQDTFVLECASDSGCGVSSNIAGVTDFSAKVASKVDGLGVLVEALTRQVEILRSFVEGEHQRVLRRERDLRQDVELIQKRLCSLSGACETLQQQQQQKQKPPPPHPQPCMHQLERVQPIRVGSCGELPVGCTASKQDEGYGRDSSADLFKELLTKEAAARQLQYDSFADSIGDRLAEQWATHQTFSTRLEQRLLAMENRIVGLSVQDSVPTPACVVPPSERALAALAAAEQQLLVNAHDVISFGGDSPLRELLCEDEHSSAGSRRSSHALSALPPLPAEGAPVAANHTTAWGQCTQPPPQEQALRRTSFGSGSDPRAACPTSREQHHGQAGGAARKAAGHAAVATDRQQCDAHRMQMAKRSSMIRRLIQSPSS